MLIHITPQTIECAENCVISVKSVEVPELGVFLSGGKEVIQRKPYRNKRYLVACRKIGNKAVSGIIFETNNFINEYTSITKWEIQIYSQHFIATHIVKYKLLDNEFDLASDNILLWTGFDNFENRKPPIYNDAPPIKAWPCYDFLYRDRVGTFTDTYHDDYLISKREEIFILPTVESERLKIEWMIKELRTPSRDLALKVNNR